MRDRAWFKRSVLLTVRTPVLTGEPHDAAAGPGSASARTDPEEQCPACGAELAEDQEWCLECGAAMTVIHAPPDWRVGLVIVLAVVAAVVIVAAVVWP